MSGWLWCSRDRPSRSSGRRSLPCGTRRRVDADPVAAEVDRVLDKISEKGISSLTPAERRFLDEVAKQKKTRPLD